jgi:hypothetical protein
MRQIVTVSMAALLLVGCGPKGPKLGVVKGTVTYKGQPVNGAALLLYPATDGQAASFTVPVTQEGEFRINPGDVPAGEYKVVVEGSEGVSQVPPALLKSMPKEKQAEMKAELDKMSTPPTIPFPKKYKDLKTTDLRCTITDKDQTMNLELKD